jgi:putative DNA primase/helicase
VRLKSNIGPDGDGFSYSLVQASVPDEPDLNAQTVIWTGALEGSGRDLLAEVDIQPLDDPTKVACAVEWLRGELGDGPMPAQRVKIGGQAAGHSWRTIERAKNDLGVRATKTGMTGGWEWQLP